MSDELERVREGYDRWAAVYAEDGNPLTSLEEPRIKAAAGEVRGSAVLDLGCGTGRHTAWLAAAGAAVTALDFSEGMLREARRKTEGHAIHFVTHDLRHRLPFADDAFDVVVSGLVLEHVRDLRAFFREVHRVTRSGGRAAISAMHPAMFLRGSQARFTDPASGELVAPGSVRHELGEITMAALAAGFVVHAIHEHAPDRQFAEQFPRAAKYVDWPMLVVFELRVPSVEERRQHDDALTIIHGGLDDDRVRALLEYHVRTVRAATAIGSAHALDFEALRASDMAFWSAWRESTLLGLGALKRLSPTHGEIKSMHTSQAARRQGVGDAMLRHIMEAARQLNLTRLSLETGSWAYFDAARALYARRGFVYCPPFGDYVEDANSVFMTLELTNASGSSP